MIKNFEQVYDRVSKLPPVKIVVAGGNDPDVIAAVEAALERGIVARSIIVGDVEKLQKMVSSTCQTQIELVAAHTNSECAEKAVAAISAGKADILMKGHVDSGSYLRAIVNKQSGICRDGLLSNVTIASMPSYHKLLLISDNGIMPAPNLDQKRVIITNTAQFFGSLNIRQPKVAVIAASEKVSEKLVATLDAQQLAFESEKGALAAFLVDGPFGYDVAVSKDAAQKKGLGASKVAGDADLILCPTIETANALAKSWKLHGAAETGSIILGAQVPIMLNSRSDGVERRLNGLSLAILAANSNENGDKKET